MYDIIKVKLIQTIFNVWPSTVATFAECPNNCAACEDSGVGTMTCIGCTVGFVLNGEDCGRCPTNCAECSYVPGKGLIYDTCNPQGMLNDGTCQGISYLT